MYLLYVLCIVNTYSDILQPQGALGIITVTSNGFTCTYTIWQFVYILSVFF